MSNITRKSNRGLNPNKYIYAKGVRKDDFMLYESFLNYGAKLQWESRSIKESKRHYDNSCAKCCLRGYQIKCRDCQIQTAHDEVQTRLLTEGVRIHA